MKILFVGDTHGNLTHTRNVFAHACRMEADRIVQVGDFGYGWDRQQFAGTDGRIECRFTRKVSEVAQKTGIPLYWLPGNHENYDFLEETLDTLEAKPDGTYELAPMVFYIPRGALLEIDGKRLLFCGGAVSIDKKRRTPGKSWWPQELITPEDVAKCAVAGQVDVLITHDFPWECEVVDRHLAPYWGAEAQDNTIKNRKNISRILETCGAKLNIHGHLHVSYTELIQVGGNEVKVVGLDCDGTPMSDCTVLLNV